MLKRGILREGHKGGVVERWAEHRISFFLSCCFQSSPVSMATSCRRQGDSSERKGTRPLLKRMANLCVCAFVRTRGLARACVRMESVFCIYVESFSVTETCIIAHRCRVYIKSNNVNVGSWPTDQKLHMEGMGFSKWLPWCHQLIFSTITQ